MLFFRIIFHILISFVRPPWGIMIFLTGMIVGTFYFVGTQYFPTFIFPQTAQNLQNETNSLKKTKNQNLFSENEIRIESNSEQFSNSKNLPEMSNTPIRVPYLMAQSDGTTFSNIPQEKSPQSIPPQELKVIDMPRVGFHSLQRPTENAVHEKPLELIARKEPIHSLPQQNSEISPFLDQRLQRTTAADLPKLPTQDLMKLLNHAKWEISQQSEEILKTRDGFQNEQIQLAAMLYHPDFNVRKSLLPQLASDEQLETTNWLAELLNDPNDDVRLATALAISQQSFNLDATGLEQLKTILQADSNPKIAALSRQIEMAASGKRNGYR